MSAEQPPSLDPGENNSTAAETGADGQSGVAERYDCREIYRNMRMESDDGETAPFRCGSWDCYCCGYRMRMNLVEEIERVCTERPAMSRLLTLTLDRSKGRVPDDQDEQHRYITERWNALRTRLKREVGDFSYIWVREEQENGAPHLHAIVSRYLPQSVVSKAWDELGGGQIVDLRAVERVEKAAHYVGKYLTKDAMTGLPDGIRRYGSSADIELDVRGGGDDGDSDWELVLDDPLLDDEGAVTRPVVGADFWLQRKWGGPTPPEEGGGEVGVPPPPEGGG